jgi:hypothetical protein
MEGTENRQPMTPLNGSVNTLMHSPPDCERKVYRAMMRFLMALGLFVLVGIAALFIWIAPLYFSHNTAAEQLLAKLNKLPLPANAAKSDQGWNVGGYEGASTLCEAMAFVIIKSNEPKQDVLDFYKTHFPPSDFETDGEYYVASFDNLPQVRLPSDIPDLAEHTAPNQRSTTYAVWIILPVEDRGWDIRGW